MIKMKILDQVEKSLNDTLESLKCTLKLLNESKEDKVLEDSSKYDKEMTEEEKKIYEEEYVKVGEPLPNSCLRSYTSGDWVRMWIEPYQRRQIIDVFYPLVDYLLKDECTERPQFNQYNRYKIYDNLRDITNAILNRPLKEDRDTRQRLAETLIEIYPKNREVFWEIISRVKEAFSVDIKKEKNLDGFLKNENEIFTKKLLDIKNKHEDNLQRVMNYYIEERSILAGLLKNIESAFNEINIETSNEGDLYGIISELNRLIRYDNNNVNKTVLRNFISDLEKSDII
jgi:hypothetical protein